MKQFLQILTLILLLSSCSKEEQQLVNEPHLPAYPYSYAFNDDKTTLGRVLFYDKTLSINKSVSCGSCHKQEFAFADNKVFSPGVNVTPTLRNSMALFNLSSGGGFFWDSRESILSNLIFSPITNHIEMGVEDVDELVYNLSRIPYYTPLFTAAYGSQDVTKERIETAITAFLRSLRSDQSKFDLYEQGAANFSLMEQLGHQLFNGKAQCSSCHVGSDFESGINANIGLDMSYLDQGVGALGNPQRNGMFAVPSLRNIELTAPYMHDGRFETLEEVVNHYTSGIQQHPNLDWRLTVEANNIPTSGWWPGSEPENGGVPLDINLSPIEKEALVAFLKTLTDQNFCNDPKFSDPFRR